MRKRNHQKIFYLSEDEDKILQEKCKKSNLTNSEYIRKLIKEYEPKKCDNEVFKKYENDFNSIEKGLSTIVRNAYLLGRVDTRKCYQYINWLNDTIENMRIDLNL